MPYLTANAWWVKDRPNSHAHVSQADLRTALAKCSPEKNFEIIEVRMETTGLCYRVETGGKVKDEIVFYKQRPGRLGPSRMVLNREAESTNIITLILAKKLDREYNECYILITAFWGSKAEPEPWDMAAFYKDPRGSKEAEKASQEFWSRNALIPE